MKSNRLAISVIMSGLLAACGVVAAAAAAALRVQSRAGTGTLRRRRRRLHRRGLPPASSAPTVHHVSREVRQAELPHGRRHRARVDDQFRPRPAHQALQQHHRGKRHEAGHGLAEAPGSSHRSPPAAPNFGPGDTLVNFADTNGIEVRGHTLLWHQTAPSWFFAGDTNDPANYRATVQQRLRDYIFAVIQHFPDIYAWDVVNEVASDTPNAANPYRTDSPWYIAYSVGGADGSRVRARRLPVRHAGAHLHRPQQLQHEAHAERLQHRAAGQARQRHRIVQDVMNAGTGADIDGVGHQFHLQTRRRRSAGHRGLPGRRGARSTLVNHVTELDVSIYADPGNCFSARTIPPCLADLGANPPQSVLSHQATTVPRAVQRLQSAQRHLGHPLGRRRQSHLAQFISGDAHQPAAAVRHGRAIRSGRSGRWSTRAIAIP